MRSCGLLHISVSLLNRGYFMSREGIKCSACGKVARPAKLRFQGYDIKGWKCKCGDEFYDPDEAQKILLLNKILKKRYEVKVGQIKSNLIIRIPKELSDALGLVKGEKLFLKIDKKGKFQAERID